MKHNETVMWKEINETPTAMKNILKNNDSVIKTLTEKIKESNLKNFNVASRGTSYHALLFFKYLTEIYTKYSVTFVAPSVITMYDGEVDLSNGIFIGCSQSGMAEDVSVCMKRAKEQGAITVAITNDENSLLAKQADYHLFCSCGEEVSVAATKTYSAEMFILFWLVAMISNKKELSEKLEKIPKMIENNKDCIDKGTSVFADKLVDMKGGFVLTRGIVNSIAHEQALKLQETAYKQMKGYAYSDFYHGPVAMVSKDTPVIMYLPKGKNEELIFIDQEKIIEKILTTDGPAYIITDNEKIAEKYGNVAEIALLDNSLGEDCAIFNFALFAQMLACKISCGVGNNPDSPRALKKITITK